MKTILFVCALALTISLSGNAATIQMAANNHIENSSVSRTNSSTATKTEKTKHAHAKKGKSNTDAKKKK